MQKWCAIARDNDIKAPMAPCRRRALRYVAVFVILVCMRSGRFGC
jgi:hypothetical protein